MIREPTPGSFHIRARPPTAAEALTIRLDNGTPSRWAEEVPVDAPAWVFQTTLPEEDLAIWVNGNTCSGRFDVQALFETDLLLTVSDSECVIEVVGLHPEGALEHRFAPASEAPASVPSAT
ncbi:MAG: hypothetical protein H0U13_04740 [Gemmatimonadaceae bacterium]|nr:hypothetical protein [Gemmatimonadaceae bacterium]